MEIGGTGERPHSQSCWVFRSDLFPPVTGGKALFTGTLQVPQLWGSISSRQVPLAAQSARECEC